MLISITPKLTKESVKKIIVEVSNHTKRVVKSDWKSQCLYSNPGRHFPTSSTLREVAQPFRSDGYD